MKNSTLSFKSGILTLLVLVSCVYVLRSFSSTSTKVSFQAVSTTTAACVGVDTSDAFSANEISQADGIDDFLTKVRGGNDLITFANSGEDLEEFKKNYLIHLIPFIAIGVVMFFLSVICLCCHCCNYKYFRRCAAPTKANKWIYITLSVIFSMLMIGTAVAGWHFTRGLESAYQRTSCAGSNMILSFSNGDSELKWLGVSPGIADLQNIQTLIVQTINNFPDVDQARTNMTTSYDNLNQTIQAFYTNNSGITVPDPNTTNAATIIPDFIQTLGPSTENETQSGLLLVEAYTKYNAIDTVLQSLGDPITSFKSQNESINSAIQTGIDAMISINSTLTDALSDYLSEDQIGQKINNGLSIGITVFFILAASLSVVIFLGVINTFTCKYRVIYKAMIFIRYFLNILLIFFSLATAIIFPTLIAATEFCNAMQATLTNEALFTGYANIASSDYSGSTLSEYVNTCLYGNGNILGNWTTEITNLSFVTNEIETVQQYTNTSQIPDSVIIPIQQVYINLYQNGELPVTSGVQEELNQLNTWTNGQCTQDIWQLNSINCTSANGTAYDASNGPKDNYPHATCIGFNQFGSTQPSQRYGTTIASSSECSADLTSAEQLISGFEAHLTSVSQAFEVVNNSLATVSSSNAQFMSELRGVIQPFVDVGTTVTNLVNIVTNNETGILVNLNCSFIKSNAQNVVDNICIAYLPILFLTSAFVLAFGLATLFGLLPIFFAGRIQMEEKLAEDLTVDDTFNRRYLMEKDTQTLELSLRL